MRNFHFTGKSCVYEPKFCHFPQNQQSGQKGYQFWSTLHRNSQPNTYNGRMKDKVTLIGAAGEHPELKIPLFSTAVRAGFPSPADDYVEQSLDLNALCIEHPASTYIVRVDADADSMIDAGIYPGDYLVVDRSVQAGDGDVVIAQIDGDFTVKELSLSPLALLARNDAYPAITISDESELVIFGVVVSVVRKMRKRK